MGCTLIASYGLLRGWSIRPLLRMWEGFLPGILGT